MSKATRHGGALLLLAIVLCTCTFDFDDSISAASATVGGTGGGGGAVAGGGLPGGGSAGSAAGGGEGASSGGSSAVSSAAGCVESDPQCGFPDHVCCTCTTQCGPNLLCSDGVCQCGGGGQPCCSGNCDGDFMECFGGTTCLHCCGACKGDPGLVKHASAPTAAACKATVKARCDDLASCNNADPAKRAPCCSNPYSCINTEGLWSYCP